MNWDELSARAFEEPDHPEVREALPVCADMLEAKDDPRGPLVAMELALRDAEPRRAVLLRRAIDAHASAHGARLGLGIGVEILARTPRVLELEWRAGRIFAATVDVSRIPGGFAARDLVEQVINMPAASELRRLRVRISRNNDARRLHYLLADHFNRRERALEELEILRPRWPEQFGAPNSRPFDRDCPHLWWYAELDVLHPVMSAEAYATIRLQLELADPATPAGRACIGRMLTMADAIPRTAALERLARVGIAGRAFARALRAMLRGRIVRDHELALVEALHAVDPSWPTLELLARVASRAQYELDVRRRAGLAVAAIRAKLVPRGP